MTVLLDTNIVVEHLRSGSLNQTNPDINFAISVITETELLRYPGLGEKETEIIETFLSITRLIPIDSIIARHAATIGKTRKTKLPDLLIAATAIQLNIPLITKNVKDFLRIPKLIVREKI